MTRIPNTSSPRLVHDLKLGLEDPALLNALMFTLAFAANGGDTNAECLTYQGNAFNHLNQTMSMPEGAAKDSTIMAILLLTGVEVGFLVC